MPPNPSILIDFHPLFRKLQEMASDPATRASMIAGIHAGGDPKTRLQRIKGDGLLRGYGNPGAAEALLLGGKWGSPEELCGISDSLCDALEQCEATGKALKVSWASGATTGGAHASVVEAAVEICFVLLTPALGLTSGSFLNGKSFDNEFRTGLQAHGTKLNAYTDSL